MATKSINPTLNQFSFLTTEDVEIQQPKRSEKQAAPAGAGAKNTPLTPGEKAQQRKEKQAAKKPADKPRQQQQRTSQVAAPVEQDPDNEGFQPFKKKNAPKKVVSVQVDDGKVEHHNNPRRHDRARPNRGREFDRHSASAVPNKPQTKKGGAGKGNVGTLQDIQAGQKDGQQAAEPVVQDATDEVKEESPKVEEKEEEEVDNSRTLEEFLAEKKQKEAELQALLGNTPAPREVEQKTDVRFLEPERATSGKKNQPKKTTEPAARKGERVVGLDEIFNVYVVSKDQGTNRNGNRGGRGGGRGGRGGARGNDKGPSRRGGRKGNLNLTSENNFPELSGSQTH